MKALLWSGIVMLSLGLPSHADYIETRGAGQINWSQQTVEVTGSGVPRRTGQPAQEKLLARRAATADAYRRLLELVEGVQVSAETSVIDYVTASDVIRTRVQGVIKGAQIVSENQSADGASEVTLRLPLFGPLAQAIGYHQVITGQQPHLHSTLPLNQMWTSTESPWILARCDRFGPSPDPVLPATPETPSPVLEQTVSEVVPVASESEAPPAEALIAPDPDVPFTGLIIDARGLNIQASMSPLVHSEAGQVYIGPFELDIDKVINEGIMLYFDTLEEAQRSPRAGSHPLIVRATGTGKHRVDFAIDPRDAAQIKAFDTRDGFLKNLQVVAVL